MWAVFLVALFSLLQKSNLVPTSLADATSGFAPHLRLCDVTFAQDHYTLLVHKTKTIQFGQSGHFKLCYHLSLIQFCAPFQPCNVF